MKRKPPTLQRQLEQARSRLDQVNQQLRSMWTAASTEPIESITKTIEKQSQDAIQMYLRAMAKERRTP